MNHRVAKALLLAASLCVGLLMVEGGMRLLDFTPAPPFGYHVYRWAQPDTELGWRLRPGVWPVDILQQPMTIADDGTRLSISGPAGSNRVLLVGGSYALGYGVLDHETLASQLQRQWPWAHVVNAAVPGYGAYQSYLAARRYVQEHPDEKPDMVLYGYCQHHDIRNTRDLDWLLALQTYSGEQIVHPHLHAKDGKTWQEYGPGRINLLGLADDSLLVRHLQRLWIERRYPELDKEDHRAATRQALRLFAAWGKEQGIPVVVADMFCYECAWLQRFCAEIGLEYLDVAPGALWMQKGWFLEKGGVVSSHPNARFYEHVAQKLGEAL